MDRVGNDRVKLLDMLTYLTFETSCIEEDIPMYMCDDCQVNLTTAYNLKVLCAKNNIHVRRYLFYLKQFTHPTSFTSETEVRRNCPVDKEKPAENTKKKSGTDEIITIQLDLTNISDESDVEITEIQNEPKTVQTEDRNNPQTSVEQQCETSNTSILSERPEFNSKLLQSKNTSANVKSGVNDVKSNNNLYNKVVLIKETLLNSRQTNSASRVSPETRILSNRPEFNVYKNMNAQTNQVINCKWYNKIKSDLNNKLTSNASQQSATVVNPKVKFKSSNNFTSCTNKNVTSLKRKSEEKLVKTEKQLKTQCTAQESKNPNVQKPVEFNDFDIVSTVKLRKRKLASVLPTPINNKSLNKKHKKTYNIKKDKKAIQRMNKCKVLLHRVNVIMNEQSSVENETSMEEIQYENNHNDINLVGNNDNEGIKIKEEPNDELENTEQNSTATQNNTNNDNESIIIKEELNDELENTDQNSTATQNNNKNDNKSIIIKEESNDDLENREQNSILSASSTTQDEQSINVVNFENILIKEEACDIEDRKNIKNEDKSVQDDTEFSFKIEIVDDNSSNSVKIETIGEDLNNTVHSVTSAENIVNNSVFSFSNAEFLNCDESLNTSKDLTESTTKEYETGIVGNANVTKSTREYGTATVGSANVIKSTKEHCTATVGSANVTKSTREYGTATVGSANVSKSTNCDKSLNTTKDMSKSTTQDYYTSTVGSANVTNSTREYGTATVGSGNVTKSTREHCTVTVGSANVPKSTDKHFEAFGVISDNNITINTTCDDSTDSDELIIDEDATSNDATFGSIASAKSVTKPVPPKVLSLRCFRKNVYKRYLDFTTNETVARDGKQTSHVEMLSLTPLLKKTNDSDSDSEQSIVVEDDSVQSTLVEADSEQTKTVSGQRTAVKGDFERTIAVKTLSEPTTVVKTGSESTIAVKAVSEPAKAVPERTTVVKALPEHTTFFKTLSEQTTAVSDQTTVVKAVSKPITAVNAQSKQTTAAPKQTEAVQAGSYQVTFFKAPPEQVKVIKTVFEQTKAIKADSYQATFVKALSEQIKADSYRATFVETHLSEQSRAVQALSEPTTTYKAIFEPTTLAKAIFEATTVAKPVSEVKKELFTVQLPNYKFPVNKRLLNFTSNVAPTSSHLQPEPDKLPTLNGKLAPGKTTIGSPALVEKPATTLRDVRKKVGSAATVETSVGRTEESTADVRMSPFQLMLQEMSQGSKTISNNIATVSADENTCTSVDITDKSEETSSSNTNNLLSTTSDDRHQCPECNKSFPRAFKLKQHMLIHKNFYHCPICIENFPTKSKFKAHMLKHKEHKYKCFMCDRIVSTNEALVQHYKVDHKNTRICHKCKLIFNTRTAHILHKKTHQPKRTCPICDQQFTESAFKEHKLSHKLSKCTQCEKYVDIKQLSTHNCRALCEKTYKCTECPMTFYFQPSLDKHMRVHYESRCFICNKTFYKPHAIVEHMSNHFGTKGYQCPKCHFCSFSKDNIKIHIANDCKILVFQAVNQ